MLIGNFIFGNGALSSRLGDRIRQKEGLSYGVSSSLSVSPFDQHAVLTITAICNPRNIGRVETAAREELDRLVRDGVTQEELEQARRGYLEARIVGRSSDPALAGLLNSLTHEKRTMEFEAALEKNIRALTPGQVSTAWRTHVDPKNLVVVTAGDFEAKPTPAAARTE
jgi:zinc protease